LLDLVELGCDVRRLKKLVLQLEAVRLGGNVGTRESHPLQEALFLPFTYCALAQNGAMIISPTTAPPRQRTNRPTALLTHKRSFSHLHFDPKPDPQSGH
jgi:hypothetical protein